jgi:DNA-binding CsgD family transcriptional regulator
MSAPRNIKEQILRLRHEGKSYREIEKELNCSRGNVWFHCNNNGLNDTGKKLHPITKKIKRQIAKYCKKHTCLQASKHFGLSIATIKNYRKFEG